MQSDVAKLLSMSLSKITYEQKTVESTRFNLCGQFSAEVVVLFAGISEPCHEDVDLLKRRSSR